MNFTYYIKYRTFRVEIKITDFQFPEFIAESVIAVYEWCGQESRIPLPSAMAAYLVSQYTVDIINTGKSLSCSD